MSTKVIKALDAAERAELANQTQKIAGMPLPLVDLENGNEFVFVAYFDGTLNDKDNLHLQYYGPYEKTDIQIRIAD